MKLSFTLLTTLGALTYSHADAVRVQIKGPDGHPVAGAKVRVVESSLATRYTDTSPARDFATNAQGILSFASKGALLKVKDSAPLTKSTIMARVSSPGLAVRIVALSAGNNTITLAKGQTLDGVTLDANARPISGVRLGLGSLGVSGQLSEQYGGVPDALKVEARSDAQGHWQMAGFPLTGTGLVQVRDARFKNENFLLDLKQKAPPFFLETGAGIKGRLLRPDGTPAKGVRLSVDNGYGSGLPVTTDANGRFEAAGLTRPHAYLQVPGDGKNLPFVAPPRMVSGLQAGQMRDIGDWKTVTAESVKGQVVDAQTKKPIANAQINGRFGNIWRNVVSNEKGEFTLLSAPGAFTLTLSAPGFAGQSQRGKVVAQKGANLGTIALQKGYVVSGVAVDEAGKPVSVYLYINRSGNRDYIRTNEKDGKFTLDTLLPGKYTLGIYGAKIISGATFKIVRGLSPKLRVVVSKRRVAATTTQRSRQDVVGRVIDGDGNPVGGAKIKLAVKRDGWSFQTLNAFSQSDGSFTVKTYIPNATVSVTRVVRPGYVRVGEQTETQKDGLHIALTLQKRGPVLRGRVVNSQGQGVAGAYVGMQNGDELPVATDEGGNFSLPDAPQWGMTLLASSGPSLATFAVEKGGPPIEITLPDAPPTNKEELADKILPGAAMEYDWGNGWDALGWKRIEALALKGVGERGGSDWLWVRYLETLAHREPKTFLARESELRAATNVTGQEGFERMGMLARAKAGDAAQRAEVTAWLSEEEKRRLDLSMTSVLQLLSVAEVAAQFDPKQGLQWLDYADQVLGQLDFKRGGDSVWTLGRLAARIGPTAPQKLGQDWTLDGKMEILLVAMQTWNEDGNAKGALAGWKQLNALSAELRKHPVPNPRKRAYYRSTSEILKQAQAYYALTLAKTDVKAALAIIMTLNDTDYRKRGYLLSIARLAVRAKQYDVARTALKALNWTARSDSTSTAEIAEITQEFDPALASTLWAREFSRSRSDFVEDWQYQETSDVGYAKTRARKWPGESRILLEREWKRRFEALPKKKMPQREYYYEYGNNPMTSLVEAVARVSPTRALEMVDALPQSESYKARCRFKIMVALLQPSV